MAKWIVSGWSKFNFKLEIEADSWESAVGQVEDVMTLGDLLDHASGEVTEVDDARAVVGPRGTVTTTE